MKFFFNHDSLTEASLASAAKVAMALEGLLEGF